MEPKIQFVRREDGVRIAYSKFGKGPCLIVPAPWVSNLAFLLQNTITMKFWGNLAKNMEIILYDKHGCGQSDRNRKEYSLESEILTLGTIINHIAVDTFILLGISQGGPISITYAERNPHRVSHLILYGTFASRKGDEMRSALVPLIRASWGIGSKVLVDLLTPGASKEEIELWNKYQRESCSPEVAAKLMELTLTMDVTDLLPKIKMPTLILHKEGDRMVPIGLGRHLASEIPNAQFRILQGEDHFITRGDTDALINEIIEFVKKEKSTEPKPEDMRYQEKDILPHEPETIKQATIVFSDIVSSTHLVTELGDAAARKLFLQHDEIIRDQLRKYGGKELQNLGDGFMLSFESASSAINCASDIQKEITKNLPSFEIRIGINTGEIVLREGQQPFGQAVVIASRIASKAQSGQILVSDVTKQLVAGSKILFVDKGRAKLKGFDESIKLHEVVWRE